MTKRKQEDAFEESWDEPSDSEMFETYSDMKILPEQLTDLDLRLRYANYLAKHTKRKGE